MPEQDPTTEPIDDDAIEIEDIDENEDGDETEPAEPEWTPPTKEQWEATQAKLNRARKQAQQLREKQQAKSSAAPANSEAAATAAADLEKWQQRAVRASARAALIQRGADPELIDLPLSKLRVNQVEFDDDGDPDLLDWLDEMEERHPKVFKPAEAPAPATAQRPRAGRIETPTGAGPRPRMSLGERILANSQGGPRRPR